MLTIITTVESKLMLKFFPSWTFPVRECVTSDVNRLVIAIEDIEIKVFSLTVCAEKRQYTSLPAH